ncbi:DsbE family thiol:disulfide interchange protein [Novosphingobium sp.]|uniref:DsbE family thiol:disulfide interchange protein n=1 Tax=Novosphingobium sp. TaxID=1874826 RepID=UPI0022C306F8|nr:DsbE family thiol:disulfide interchange protein [Novosphingobium sp.]MCZ8017623.1 DsbE family thiol:disulfide interchange protein [Novosphingobium sp.]MCZ8033853.1 DsbE family thiol:disulfide interchange protein [Novosphingobium sp.]MCZ8051209.1 DsbE family thiol:disulfide interchange protein [Novosphingobium sp.]MCZ8059555.1 DsbE family thiol:disulfide interchange protein [Novosphingobium sp.]MCZ8231393.1 DsbE family thiol:disulfide interchange protein [Novosphingobium sp.]
MSEPHKPSRWTLWLPLMLFLGFAGLAMSGLFRPAEREVESAMIGKPMPQFTLRAAVPERPGLSTADLADGKPRLLNVFASWCLPCAVEAPQLAALEAEGIEIVGVAIRDRPEDVAAFLARHGNPFSRIGADDRSEVQLGIGSSGVPETFVIDGQGKIRYQHIGEIRPEHLALLRDKLKEAGS